MDFRIQTLNHDFPLLLPMQAEWDRRSGREPVPHRQDFANARRALVDLTMT